MYFILNRPMYEEDSRQVLYIIILNNYYTFNSHVVLINEMNYKKGFIYEK